jgi:predicted anti-sigma-YlaC factor YlaD
MKNESCQRYLEDPEGNASHLETCEECRALFAPDDIAVKESLLSVDALPMAPWEGASHRSWPLTIATGVVVLFSAVTLFLMAGMAPVTGLLRSLSTAIPSADLILSASRLVGNGLQHAPLTWQLAIGAGFIAVNTVFILLLRRAPRGIDV